MNLLPGPNLFPAFSFSEVTTCIGSTLHLACICIIKVVPWPIPSLSTCTFPPIFSRRLLQILRPSPVPRSLAFWWSSRRLKFRKSFERFSFAIPTPESLILISKVMYFFEFTPEIVAFYIATKLLLYAALGVRHLLAVIISNSFFSFFKLRLQLFSRLPFLLLPPPPRMS
jgi:hypothetical protein